MNRFIYEFVYFVPICIFIYKLNRGGGGLPRKDNPLLLRATTMHRKALSCLFHSKSRIRTIPLISDVKRERGNPPPFRPNFIHGKAYHPKYIHCYNLPKEERSPSLLPSGNRDDRLRNTFTYSNLRRIFAPRNLPLYIFNFTLLKRWSPAFEGRQNHQILFLF